MEPEDERIIFFEALPKPESRIQHDPFAPDSNKNSPLRPLLQLALDQQDNITRWRKTPPFLRTTAHVHEDHTTLQLRDGLRHGRIPPQSAYVIHDLSPGTHSGPGHSGLISVNRNQDFGMPSL